MSAEPDELYEAAVALPEEKRAELVMKLLDSLGVDPDVAAAQAAESAARLAAIESGELETVDEDEAFRLINS
jgi:hypothetical protein